LTPWDNKLVNTYAALQKKPMAGSYSAGVIWNWTEVSLVSHSGLSSMEDSEAKDVMDVMDELDCCLLFCWIPLAAPWWAAWLV